MDEIDDKNRNLMMKLECIRDIRSKVSNVDKLRSRLTSEVDLVQSQESTLAEYRGELEQLLQEKMAHVEELRQIHADINAMEGIIKQAEEIKSKALDNARRLYEEYQPLKNDTNRMIAMNLPRTISLPSLANDDDPVPPNFFEKSGIDWSHEGDDMNSQPPSMPPLPSSLSNLPSSLSGIPSLAGLGGGPPQYLSHQQSLPPMRSPQKVDQRPLPPPTGPPAPTFRQQPPPMKSCLSCHQQIHRNAPICPLCKAKSRSRNPKKPKKKE